MPIDATAYTGARFGQGLVPIFLDNVACQGPESRLIDCSHDDRTTDCSHSEDASVQCQRKIGYLSFLNQPLVIFSSVPSSTLPKWGYQAGGRGITARRASGGVYGWRLGHSVC